MRAESPHESLLLLRELQRHDKNDLIAAGESRESYPQTGIAGRSLDDCAAGTQQSFFLRVRYHILSDTILDAASRIEELKLGKKPRGAVRDDISQSYHRRIADKFLHG